MRKITLNLFWIFVIAGSVWSALLGNYGGAIAGLLLVVIYQLREIHGAIKELGGEP